MAKYGSNVLWQMGMLCTPPKRSKGYLNISHTGCPASSALSGPSLEAGVTYCALIFRVVYGRWCVMQRSEQMVICHLWIRKWLPQFSGMQGCDITFSPLPIPRKICASIRGYDSLDTIISHLIVIFKQAHQTTRLGDKPYFSIHDSRFFKRPSYFSEEIFWQHKYYSYHNKMWHSSSSMAKRTIPYIGQYPLDTHVSSWGVQLLGHHA